MLQTWIIDVFILTGGIFWILVFAFCVGWIADKFGIRKK